MAEHPVRWWINSAYESRKECEEVGVKEQRQLLESASKAKQVAPRLVCLPDTVDPRDGN